MAGGDRHYPNGGAGAIDGQRETCLDALAKEATALRLQRNENRILSRPARLGSLGLAVAGRRGAGVTFAAAAAHWCRPLSLRKVQTPVTTVAESYGTRGARRWKLGHNSAQTKAWVPAQVLLVICGPPARPPGSLALDTPRKADT